MTAAPKAYSYLRFSTPAQLEGDSFRRQTALADRYAKDHGLVIDRSLKYEDLGISAFRGANAETGRLADFKEAVRAGLVPVGSVLLVESLDRLSRLVPRMAIRVLEDIIVLGIEVVTLNDGKSYTLETIDNDHSALLIALIYFMRANEESATKSLRIKAAWEGKRLLGKPMTAACPAWLTLDKVNGVFIVDPNKAKVLVSIFEDMRLGTGLESITKRLNKEGVPPFGRGKMWHRSYVNKIRDNPAVIGTFTPHQQEHTASGMKRIPMEPWLNYFPAVIDPIVFSEVQVMNQGRNPSTKTVHGLKSLLAGLAACPLCDSAMTRVNKVSGSKPFLVCTNAKVGKGCKYHGVHIDIVEAALIDSVDSYLSEPPFPDTKQRERCDYLNDAIMIFIGEIESILEAIAIKALPSLIGKLEELEGDLEATKTELKELENKIGDAGDYGLILSRTNNLITIIKEEPLDIVRVNAGLRQLFSRVTVDYRSGDLIMHWKQGGETQLSYAWVD
jgi:DNA invertase Pin-like site-specific DNA recombinase